MKASLNSTKVPFQGIYQLLENGFEEEISAVKYCGFGRRVIEECIVCDLCVFSFPFFMKVFISGKRSVYASF